MFSVSLKCKYGLAAIYCLGLNFDLGPVQSKSISIKYDIPQRFLEQVLLEFKRSGLVHSFRGKHGGYSLAKNPEFIKIYDVMCALDGDLQTASGAVGDKEVKGFWSDLQESLLASLQFSLKDLIIKGEKINNIRMYTI